MIARDVAAHKLIDKLYAAGCGWIVCLSPGQSVQMRLLEEVYLLWGRSSDRIETPTVVHLENDVINEEQRQMLRSINARLICARGAFATMHYEDMKNLAQRNTVIGTPSISSARDVMACLEAVASGSVVVSRMLVRSPADAIRVIQDALSQVGQASIVGSRELSAGLAASLSKIPVAFVDTTSSGASRVWLLDQAGMSRGELVTA